VLAVVVEDITEVVALVLEDITEVLAEFVYVSYRGGSGGGGGQYRSCSVGGVVSYSGGSGGGGGHYRGSSVVAENITEVVTVVG
jgi:uncharacterized membrane protein YgcG